MSGLAPIPSSMLDRRLETQRFYSLRHIQRAFLQIRDSRRIRRVARRFWDLRDMRAIGSFASKRSLSKGVESAMTIRSKGTYYLQL